jgi:hypothetical protein
VRRALLLIPLALAACGGSQPDRQSSLRATLVSEGCAAYVEGFHWFVSLDGGAKLEAGNSGLTIHVPPGKHRMNVTVRPCSGTCARLDPVFDSCSRRLTLPRGETRTVVHLHPTKGCKIEVGG